MIMLVPSVDRTILQLSFEILGRSLL